MQVCKNNRRENDVVGEYMATITKVEIQKNNDQKVNVYVDGEYYNKLHLDTCVKYGIKAGIEVDLEYLHSIILESEKLLALNTCAKYVTGALKTEKQVRDYLKKKDFEDEIISHVLDKLTEYKYIDDKAYVSAYVASYKSKYGKNKLIHNLRTKGVSQDLIDDYYDYLEDCDIEDDTCYNIATKKARNMDLSDIKNIQKLNRFLVSRGFDFDEISNVINRLKKGE